MSVLSACKLATTVNSGTTADSIEMPFGSVDLVGPTNHVLDGVQLPPREEQLLGENAVCSQTI